MPNYPVHRRRAKGFSWGVVKVALLAVGAVILLTNEAENIGWGAIVVCLIGAAAFFGVLLPDIDHHSSIPRRHFERVTRLVIPLGLVAIGLKLLSDYVTGVSQDIKTILVVGLLLVSFKLFLSTPDLIEDIMPAHRKLLHRPYFWTITGGIIATFLFTILSKGPSEVGGVPLVPFAPGTTTATYAIGGIALATGGAVTLGAHQHLEQDGILHSEFNPGPTVRIESELAEALRWLIDEAAYRLQLAHIEQAAGIVVTLVTHAFRELFAAIAESIAERSFKSFRKRLTLRDVIVIIFTITVVILLVYLAIRFFKWLLSDSTDNSEPSCPSSLDETMATLEGTNGTLEATYESVTVDRERWMNRHHGYTTKTIPLEEISAFNIGTPGLITDGYLHVENPDSEEPKANILAHRNQTTVKYENRTEAILWSSEVDRIRKWKRSLSTSPDPITYLMS